MRDTDDLFGCCANLGVVALCDGSANEKEDAWFESYLATRGDLSEAEHCRKLFHSETARFVGTTAQIPIVESVMLSNVKNPQLLFRDLIALAKVDGDLNEKEIAILGAYANKLDIPQELVAGIMPKHQTSDVGGVCLKLGGLEIARLYELADEWTKESELPLAKFLLAEAEKRSEGRLAVVEDEQYGPMRRYFERVKVPTCEQVEKHIAHMFNLACVGAPRISKSSFAWRDISRLAEIGYGPAEKLYAELA